MADWTAGYVTDIDYTHGYFVDMNPVSARLALLRCGYRLPRIATACELGFGQGLSTLIHAAGSDVRWYGNDFNPSQVAFASELADAAGCPCSFSDDSFEQYLARVDLPNFDFIALHGVWSWISKKNRKLLTKFIKNKLNPGGLLYVSYNTMPGWSTFAPVRHLLKEHENIIGSSGESISDRITNAMAFADHMFSVNPMFSRANPGAVKKLESIKDEEKSYLAHEYFNEDWEPVFFSSMVKALSPAKMLFACSSALQDHIDSLNLTEEQRSFLSKLPNENFQQTVRDFLTNQNFRREYWLKGANKLSSSEQTAEFRSQRFVLVCDPKDVTLEIKGNIGTTTLKEDIYHPILEAFDKNPLQAVSELELSLTSKNINFSQLAQAITVLCAKAAILPVQLENAVESSMQSAHALNSTLIKKAEHRGEINYLASPVTGGGFRVGRAEQLFINSLRKKNKTAKEHALFTWNCFKNTGTVLTKEGEPLLTDEENLLEIEKSAIDFLNVKFPIYKRLMIF